MDTVGVGTGEQIKTLHQPGGYGRHLIGRNPQVLHETNEGIGQKVKGAVIGARPWGGLLPVVGGFTIAQNAGVVGKSTKLGGFLQKKERKTPLLHTGALFHQYRSTKEEEDYHVLSEYITLSGTMKVRITEMKKQKDGRYRAKITAPDGKAIYLSAGTQRELEKKKQELREQLITGGQRMRDITFHQLIIDWFTIVKKPRIRTDSTLGSYRAAINYHILPYFDVHQQARAVSYTQLQQWADSLGGMHSRQIGQCISIVRHVLDYGITEHYLTVNAALPLLAPISTRKTKQKGMLMQEQAARLLEKVETADVGPLIMLMYCLGVRIGEACALKWADVDFARDMIHVHDNIKHNHKKGQAPTGDVKTAAGDRYIPMPAMLREYLFKRRGLPGALVAPMEPGEAWYYRQARARFMAYMEQQGVENVTFHWFRHNYATGLYVAGVDAGAAMRLIGHADYNTTVKIYTHIADLIRNGGKVWVDPYFAEVAERLPKRVEITMVKNGETLVPQGFAGILGSRM